MVGIYVNALTLYLSFYSAKTNIRLIKEKLFKSEIKCSLDTHALDTLSFDTYILNV